MKNTLCLLMLFLSYQNLFSQDMSAEALIFKSIQYHDPNDQWLSFQDTLHLKQETPNGISYRTVYLDRQANNFYFKAHYAEGRLEYEVFDGQASSRWNDQPSIPDTIREKYRVSAERPKMYHNYYSYLYGMPMKLHDPGSIIKKDVQEVDFHGQSYYKIQVNYDSEVGSDTWYFYFNKSNYALTAYEFWKKEPGDGEYLLLDGIQVIDGIKLPANIAWYMTVDDRWLGTDMIEP